MQNHRDSDIERFNDAKNKLDAYLSQVRKFGLLSADELNEYNTKRNLILPKEDAHDIELLKKTMGVIILTNALLIDIKKNMTKEKVEASMQNLYRLPEISLTTEGVKLTDQIKQINEETKKFMQMLIQGNIAANQQYKQELEKMTGSMNAWLEEINKIPDDKITLKNDYILKYNELYEKHQALSEKIKKDEKENFKKPSIRNYTFTSIDNSKLNKVQEAAAHVYFEALQIYVIDQLNSITAPNPGKLDVKKNIENLFPGLTYEIKEKKGKEFVEVFFKNKNEVHSLEDIIIYMQGCAVESNKLIYEGKKSFFSPLTSSFLGEKPITYLDKAIQGAETSNDFSIKKLLKVSSITVNTDQYMVNVDQSYFNEIKDTLVKIQPPTGRLADELIVPVQDRHLDIEKDLADFRSDFATSKGLLASELENAKTKVEQNASQPPVLPDINGTGIPSSPVGNENTHSLATFLSEDLQKKLMGFLIEQRKRIVNDERIFIDPKITEKKGARITTYLERIKLTKQVAMSIIDELEKDNVLNQSRNRFSLFAEKSNITFKNDFEDFCKNNNLKAKANILEDEPNEKAAAEPITTIKNKS